MNQTDVGTHNRQDGGVLDSSSSSATSPAGEEGVSPRDAETHASGRETPNWLAVMQEIISGEGSGDSPEERRRKRRANVPGRIAAVALSIGITVAIILFRDRLRDLYLYGYPGIFLINLVGNATIILPAPALATVFAAGAFNPVLLGLVAGLGSAMGEMTGYLAGIGGRSVVENRRLYDRFEAWMRKAGVFAIFIMAAIPNPAFDIGGMVAGASRMPVPRFLLACWAGKTVRMIVVALIGRVLLAP